MVVESSSALKPKALVLEGRFQTVRGAVPRVTERDLATTRGMRRVLARITDAVGRGCISPQRAAVMLSGVRAAMAPYEMELAERINLRLDEIEQPEPAGTMTFEPATDGLAEVTP